MAEVYGKKLICDRCGDSIFLERTQDSESGSDLTRYERYENRPDDWKGVYLNPFGTKLSLLCPSCSEEFKIALNTYMAGFEHSDFPLGLAKTDD